MNRSASRLHLRAWGLLAFLPLAALAQPYTTPLLQPQPAAPAVARYAPQQLEQMLAPIALYPDGMLTQILIASTFPDQVLEAANWSAANPGLEGDQAVQAAQTMGWDPSVESLVAFPQLLAQMGQNPDWMRSLGHAFMAQEAMVMDSVQVLRHRAQAAGTLQSDDQLRIEQSGPALLIEPAQPSQWYVPYYDPFLAYGAWPYAAYPPVAWRPWTGYRFRPGGRSVFAWGPAVRHAYPSRYGRIDWNERRFAPRLESPRHVAPRAWSPPAPRIAGPAHVTPPGAPHRFEPRRLDPPRAESRRFEAPRFEAHRFESRRAEPRHFESHRAPSAAPRMHAPSTPGAAPAPSRPAPAAAAPGQNAGPHGRGQGHGQRGDNGQRGRGEGRGRS